MEPLDRHSLYEATVQSPSELVPFLRALHGGDARSLGEDFCAGAHLARHWCAHVPRARAVAIDIDAALLERAGRPPGLSCLQADLARWEPPAGHPACDLIYAGNFSIGYLHERAQLLHYLEGVRARLAQGGLFAADTYGGGAAWRTGAVVRDQFLADGLRLRSTWEQRSADPLRARVVNALSLRVDRDGDVLFDCPDAFVYDWRLWSPSELFEALAEVGLGDCSAYARLGSLGAAPRAIDDPRELGDPADRWAVCLAARAPGAQGV